MSDFRLTVGLEVHAELKTRTKMFCRSKNDTEEKRPNVNICPVCMGYPGSLPVINKEAVRSVLRFGVAVGGTLADYTEFDRKNYFYPDIPKGYQISQYAYPLVKGGELEGVALTRVHLEEDTAKSTHDAGEESLVDFNRAGVPLMELVTEPVIHDAATAVRFAKELQLMLRTLGLSDANMEKGEMRVEANISVSKDETFGTKVEVKNLNSFKAVEKAILFEMNRHVELLERGEKIAQETRGWDERKEATFAQRTKEDSHDYRYFPDPDLPKLFISQIPDFSVESLQASLPELPNDKRARFRAMGLKPEDVEVYVTDPEWGMFIEASGKNADVETITLLSNYILSDLRSVLGARTLSESSVTPENFRKMIEMIRTNQLSSRGAKEIIKLMIDTTESPEEIAKKNNLIQKSDEGALKIIVDEVCSTNTKAIAEYKAGKSASLQFLVGQAMKLSKGSANPELLKKLFVESIK
jgi:aspartyl-tRNA(Asn)/glutamyl-tRNA(Gln) amidotransferase subunit B